MQLRKESAFNAAVGGIIVGMAIFLLMDIDKNGLFASENGEECAEEETPPVPEDKDLFRLFLVSQDKADPCDEPATSELCLYEAGHSDQDPVATLVDKKTDEEILLSWVDQLD